MIEMRFLERDAYVKNGEPFTQPFKERTLQFREWPAGLRPDLKDGSYGIEPVWTDVPVVPADTLRDHDETP